MLVGLFVLICGARLWLINSLGNATPFWDEWDTEVKVIKAYAEGTLTPMLFFESQNEHRIALTQALVLLLFCADKKWDPILQMVAQAPLYAFSIVLFVALAGRYMSRLGETALAGFAACVGVEPFGWKNTLWGIMSCFYLLILLGIAVIWLCWRYEVFSRRWCSGAVVALASLFTMAGGLFAIVVITGFLALRMICERRKDWKTWLAGVAVLAAICVFGVAITPLHAVDNYVAKNFVEFFWALTGILSFPCGAHWACIIIQAPLIALVLVTLFRRVSFGDGRWFVILIAASFWMQALVVAYKRCGLWDASKYTDFWGMLLLVNCASLYFLHRHAGRTGPVYPFAALWLALCMYGAIDQAEHILPRQIMEFHADQLEEESNARQYLATGDPIYLQGKIPFETPELMREMLGSETIRRVLPSNLINSNPPLIPAKQNASASGFVENDYPRGVAALNKTVFGSYGIKSKSGIVLSFEAPHGARAVDLQVAGYPNARGMTLRVEERHGVAQDIVPPLDSGTNWQTISVRLDPGSSSFKIVAKDQSDGSWLAFSLPSVSTGGFPGRWARVIAQDFFHFIDLGLVLLVVGGIANLAGTASDNADGGKGDDKLSLVST